MESRQQTGQYKGLLLITTCLLITYTRSDVIDLTDVTQLCPYVEFCTSDPRTEPTYLSQEMPCCMPCFCSEFCWARADCCYDIATPSPANIAELQDAVECVSESVEFVHGQRVPIHRANTMYMWMVTKCIGPAQYHEYSDKCILKPDSTFPDLIPVWSPSTRDLYRNKYCALCYEVTDYEYLAIDIGDLNPYLEKGEHTDLAIVDFLLRHPSITNVLTVFVANITTTHVSYCNLSLASSCRNDTQFNNVIERRCEQQNQIFIYEDIEKKKFVLFKNIYCLLCGSGYQLYNETHGDMSTVPEVCMVIPGFGDLSDRGSGEFTELLDFDGPANQVRQTCARTEVLDVYMKKCRPLVCPRYGLPYNGDCLYTSDSTYAQPWTVSFLARSDTSIYPSAYETNVKLLEKFLSLVVNERLPMCSVEIAVNVNQSNPNAQSRDHIISAGFQYLYYPNIFYIRKIYEFIQSDMVLSYNVTAVLLKGIDARQGEYTHIYSLSWQEQCKGDFQVIPIWCPTVELSDADFRYCVTHKILPMDSEFNNPSTLAANQSALRQICLHDYLRAWLNSSRASRLTRWPNVLFLYSLLTLLGVN